MTHATRTADRALFYLLIGLFCCRAALASAVVPPWQGPDEPVHFALIPVLAFPDRGTTQTTVEADVLRSMAEHRWWEPYGTAAPDPLPTSLQQVRRLGRARLSQPLYYGLGAVLLRVTGAQGTEAQYWQLRMLSVLLCIVALALGWLGTRHLFGADTATGALAIASLHPQFLLAAITVNPDALLYVFGAFLWWQVARAVTGRRTTLSVAMIVAAGLLAPFVKRSGVPLSAVALTCAALFVYPHLRLTRRVFATIAIVAVAGVLVASLALLMFRAPLADLAVYWRRAVDLTRPADEIHAATALGFVGTAIDYAWLVAGWLRFPAPDAWLWVARVVTVVGFGSALVVTFRSESWRRPLQLAWLFFVGQAVLTVVVTFFTLGSPQGRLSFPVIAPATALLWIGLTHAAPATVRVWAPAAVVALMAALDATGFATVLVPAYVPWG